MSFLRISLLLLLLKLNQQSCLARRVFSSSGWVRDGWKGVHRLEWRSRIEAERNASECLKPTVAGRCVAILISCHMKTQRSRKSQSQRLGRGNFSSVTFNVDTIIKTISKSIDLASDIFDLTYPSTSEKWWNVHVILLMLQSCSEHIRSNQCHDEIYTMVRKKQHSWSLAGWRLHRQGKHAIASAGRKTKVACCFNWICGYADVDICQVE